MGGCFPCLGSPKGGEGEEKKKEFPKEGSGAASSDAARGNLEKSKSRGAPDSKKEPPPSKDGPSSKIAAQTFQFRELAAATQNFRPECLLGEGGFGRVYKGRLESSGQVVAVKQLDRNGLQGNREFLVEVLMLSLLHHPNLVSLIGYCADGDQRLLVYEFMPLGSLEDHLHAGMTDSSMADFVPIAAFTFYNALHASLPLICGPSQKHSRDACNIPLDKEPLDWITRMKIAAGAAKGLEYLHDKANPPVIYRDLKSSNILLGEGFHPKLSDFGLAKLGPVGDKTHVSTRVMGTYGYCAPEYAMTGQLTLKSDVYSFGVVLLEIITGRKAIDNARVTGEQNLVAWARPLFKDRRKFPKMADPLLEGRFPMRGLYQALAVAAMCLQEQATTRPLIADVVTALQYLASQTYDPNANPSSNRNRVGPSTKDWNDQKSLAGGSETQEDSGSNGRDRGVNSPRLDMLRQKEYVRGLSIGAEVGRGESGRGSGRKGNLDEMERPQSQRNSPVHAVKQRDSPKHLGRDKDREQAIAEARQWGENWRERKRTAAECSLGDTNK